MPIFTKAGCNAGTCHAKAGGGQNGFQLSLLGFEPAEDYTSIVQQSRGRRVFLHAPENSLLAQKGNGDNAARRWSPACHKFARIRNDL